METKKFPIEVGQEVFLCPAGNYTRMGMKPKLGVITKIARKYFYVDIQSAWGCLLYTSPSPRDCS